MRITRGDLAVCHGLLTLEGVGMHRQKAAEGIVGSNAEGPNVKGRE